MKIAVDGTPLIHTRSGYLSHQTGVGHYTYRLLNEAMELDPSNSYEIIGFRSLRDKLLKPTPAQLDFPKLKHIWVPGIPKEIYTRLLKLGSAPPIDRLVKVDSDIFFYPNFVRFPQSKSKPSVVVVYDLSFQLHPNFATKRTVNYLLATVPRSVQLADHIVTISKSARQEIIDTYAASSEKVSIIYPAVEHDVFKPQPKAVQERLRTDYKIDKPYILFVGTLEPRKNVMALINAYASLPKKLQVNYSLVLAGAKGWLIEEVSQRLQELADLDIRQIGYVADYDLPSLYSGAAVFVFPSIYEGFGMPVLEAMACGCPVITSDAASLPEVVGKAGLMVAPQDEIGLAEALVKVLEDKKLASYMSQAGLAQAKKFSWQKSAQSLLKLFHSLV